VTEQGLHLAEVAHNAAATSVATVSVFSVNGHFAVHSSVVQA